MFVFFYGYRNKKLNEDSQLLDSNVRLKRDRK